jgi:hypothetical protein
VAKILGITDIPDENADYANNLVMLVADLTDLYGDTLLPKTTAIAWGSVSDSGEFWSALLVPYNNIEADNNGKLQPAWTGTGDFYVGLMQTDDWNTFKGYMYAPDGTPVKVTFDNDRENTILSFDDFVEQFAP